jgi:hypothetical protein
MCGQWLDFSISVAVVFAGSNRATTVAATPGVMPPWP